MNPILEHFPPTLFINHSVLQYDQCTLGHLLAVWEGWFSLLQITGKQGIADRQYQFFTEIRWRLIYYFVLESQIFFSNLNGATEMAQQVKAVDTKPDNLSLILEADVEEEN